MKSATKAVESEFELLPAFVPAVKEDFPCGKLLFLAFLQRRDATSNELSLIDRPRRISRHFRAFIPGEASEEGEKGSGSWLPPRSLFSLFPENLATRLPSASATQADVSP